MGAELVGGVMVASLQSRSEPRGLFRQFCWGMLQHLAVPVTAMPFGPYGAGTAQSLLPHGLPMPEPQAATCSPTPLLVLRHRYLQSLLVKPSA